ncbi:hypothetical protein DLK05_09200 [Ancylomarina longa]|uniref:Uncharacterized protein n=1 Tax=Ancylomarina longa TaxID=2487017 RepID=A0A434AUX5_9BACT|nr:hypothetical protein DLK05_09200 [Ancylomarina longa]
MIFFVSVFWIKSGLGEAPILLDNIGCSALKIIQDALRMIMIGIHDSVVCHRLESYIQSNSRTRKKDLKILETVSAHGKGISKHLELFLHKEKGSQNAWSCFCIRKRDLKMLGAVFA